MTTAKILPDTVTHLDLIKTFAVIIMIIDHIGMYFFNDWLWFRALGRIGGAPVWFFLIGYAHTRKIPDRLFIGALILAAADFILFQKVFAMSALVTIILLRLTIDHVMNFALQNRYLFVVSSVLLAFAYIFTQMLFEYGTLALFFAMAGYMTRQRERIERETFVTKWDYYGFLTFTFFMFIFMQNAIFGFDVVQFTFMALCTAAVMVVLVTMEPMTFPQIRQPQKRFLMFCGRRTLDIYVAHLVLFKIIVFILVNLGFYG